MHSERSSYSGGPNRFSGVDGLLDGFDLGALIPRKAIIGLVLLVALIGFELFNFDTTRYALRSLLGEVSFAGFTWAGILALAFCAIDFAGLARLFTPEAERDSSRAVWYLMGAWLLGATMNAIMTWWAVSLTLLNHELGNEVLTRQQLLQIVPLFVAVLVWLTRILFIGAFAVAGEHLFDIAGKEPAGRQSGRSSAMRRPALAGAPARAAQMPQRAPAPRVEPGAPAPVAAAPVRERVPGQPVREAPPASRSGAHRTPATLRARGRRS